MRNLLAKEFLRRLRSPVPTIGMFLFPFLMAAMIGSVSGGGGGPSFPRVHVLIEDRDDSWMTQQLIGMLGSEQMSEYLRLETVGEEGRERMAQGDASALVVLPQGFSDAVLNARPTQIELLRNPSESIKPEIVEGALQLLCTYLDMGGKIFGEELQEFAALLEADGFPGVTAIVQVSEKIATRIGELERYLFPPVVQVESVKESQQEDEGPQVNMFGVVLAMISVMSVLFASSRSILDLYEEERTGMVRRMLTAPMTPGSILASKMAFAVIFGVVVEALVLGAGLLLGWFDPGLHLFGALLVAAAFSFAAAGVLSVVYALTQTEKQAGLVNFIVIMGMSALGGSFFRMNEPPPFLEKAALFTLNHWAIEALIGQLVLGEALVEAGQSLLVLTLVGVVTLSVGMAIARRRLAAVMA